MNLGLGFSHFSFSQLNIDFPRFSALACIPTGLESPSAPSGSPSGGGGSPATYAAKARGAPNLPLNPIGGNQLGSAVPNSQSVRGTGNGDGRARKSKTSRKVD